MDHDSLPPRIATPAIRKLSIDRTRAHIAELTHGCNQPAGWMGFKFLNMEYRRQEAMRLAVLLLVDSNSEGELYGFA